MEEMYLRCAENTDKEFLFALVNDEECRNNSLNPHCISKEEHEKWFGKILHDEIQKLYILMDGEESIGQGRIELKDNKCRVSYSIIPERRGCGYGKCLIKLIERIIVKVFPKCQVLYAEILKHNVASQKIFEDLGYIAEEKDGLFLYHKRIVFSENGQNPEYKNNGAERFAQNTMYGIADIIFKCDLEHMGGGNASEQ